MYSKSISTTTAVAAALFFSSTLAQSSTASPAASVSSGQTQMTGAPSAANPVSLVNALLPSAGVTSVSPEQASKLGVDASNYFAVYTASHPLDKLEADAGFNQLIGGVLGGASEPTDQQSSQIIGLLGAAPTAIQADPTAYVASINSAVAPFKFAGEVSSYADGLLQGLRTVVASDLSVSVPPQPSSTKNGAHKAVPTGVVGAAAAAAAGAVGMAML